MDNILSSLLNFGIGGCMTGSFIYFCHHVLTRTIPSMMDQHRTDMEQLEQRHKESMLRIEERYDRRDQAFLKTIETLCVKVEALHDNFNEFRMDMIRGGCPVVNKTNS